MSKFVDLVKRVACEGKAPITVARTQGYKFYLDLKNGFVALSNEDGVLFGETLNSVHPFSGESLVFFEANRKLYIAQYSNGRVLREYLDVSQSDALALLNGMQEDADNLWVSSSISDIVEKGVNIERLDISLPKDSAFKLQKVASRRKKQPVSAALFVLIAAVAGALFLMRNSEDDKEVKKDPYQEYRVELVRPTLDEALRTLVVAVSKTAKLHTWKIDAAEVGAEGVLLRMKAIPIQGVAKEISDWAKASGYSFEFQNDVVNITLPLERDMSEPSSFVIYGGIKKLMVSLTDFVHKYTMFEVSISPAQNKSNYISYPVQISGNGVILDELVGLSNIVNKLPIKVERISLKSTSAEFVFDMTAQASAVGEL